MLFPCSTKSAIVNQLEQEGLEDKNRNKDKIRFKQRALHDVDIRVQF